MARMIVPAFLLLSLAGCSYPVIPFYRSDTTCGWLMGGARGDRMRQNVEQATDDFPVIGRSTRQEVLLRLGEPDEWSDTERNFTYRWRMVVAKSIANSADVKKTYFLRIRFDDEGKVRDVETDSFWDD